MAQLLERIETYATCQPHAIALHIDDERIDYKHLQQQLEQKAMQLPDACKGQRVGLSFNQIQDFVVHYLAVLHKGGIPCVFDPKWTEARLHALYERYHIGFVLNESGIEATAYQCDTQTRPLLHIGFTSGTTGLPKAFYRNEASWIASFEQNDTLIEKTLGERCTLVALGPYAHSLTLYVMIYALFYGRTFLGQNNYNIQQCATRIASLYTPCILFLVPTMVFDWVRHAHQNSNVKHVFISGDKLSSSLHQQLKAQLPLATIDEFFGTSEASFISVNRNQTAPLNSVGTIFPNVDIHIDQPDAKGVGKLFVHSAMAFQGYVGQTPSTWIQTGDYARVDHDVLYLHGRIEDMMIIGGRNVYPSVVEHYIKKLEGIEDVIIVKQPHSKFGELAVALYIGACTFHYQTMRQQLAKVLSRYEIPSKFIRVTTLPYTSNGKVSRRLAQQKYESGDFDE
ncbi:AMP-binding protein [Staphylococcus hyicus]|uniref:AMP-binding protein n=1 Tax=Staphylococcus hyicus TaxID=1284 RepID=UPI0037350E75